MDGIKDNVSDDEFHDCLDDISNASNPVEDFKIQNMLCKNLTNENSPEADEKQKHNFCDKDTTPTDHSTGVETPEELSKANIDHQIHDNHADESCKSPLNCTDEPQTDPLNAEDSVEKKEPPEAAKSTEDEPLDQEQTGPNGKSGAAKLVHKENVDENSDLKPINHDNKEESSDESEDESCLTTSQIEERTSEAKKLKGEGNDAYKNENFDEAVRLYTEGIKICPKSSKKDRAILFSNRSACYAKMDRSDDAIKDCTSAVLLHPQYLKAYLRRADLYDKAEKYEEATKDYEQILELDSSIHSARKALMSMPQKIEIRNEKLKQQMMSSLKDLGNLFLRPFGLSTDNFQMQQNENTGSYNIQFNNKSGK